MASPVSLAAQHLWTERALIAGAWVAADSGATLCVENPATRTEIARVPACATAETERAIAAAAQAFPDWRARTARRRAEILQRWFHLILAHGEDLAKIMTLECGKPLAEARGEVAYGASFVEWFAEEGKRVYGETIPSPASDKRLVVIRQPVGVCAAITPWNFPLAMVTRKVAPALAAGCTVVVKPAEQTPLTALALARLAEEAGFPAGVLNVVTGDPVAIGAALTQSPIVAKLSFTGSTGVGRLLMAQSAPTLKRLSLELGGNAPFLVFDDADLEEAVQGAMAAKFRNAGQTCICANRFLVQAGIHDAFAQRLREAAAALRVGDGSTADTQQGPLIDDAALAKVMAHVEDAIRQGAQILTGGKPHALRETLGGAFFEPTVLTEVTPAMRIAKEETFGPIAPIFRFHTETEALRLANATEYGLAAYVYSRDIGRCIRVGEALEYGMVGINASAISNETAPFGGIKQSGLGREGARQGIEEYLAYKYLCVGVDALPETQVSA
ncbi:MAG: NAD-dependent succinate-semialdehyde dehydrogenase [Zoogloeaceae bacterium]|jgi:succinate-semialdehyde dehydrogenase/glutarate-semialdehyde dehydrogenase|nr:NAD-dependent succinate-semialdehyde dehydrogenase [Zoogloeaceae bacterium]